MSELLSEQQAKEAVEELQNKEPDWFCPLIKGTCRKDCVCYAKARARPIYHDAADWGFDEASCDNAMFT